MGERKDVRRCALSPGVRWPARIRVPAHTPHPKPRTLDVLARWASSEEAVGHGRRATLRIVGGLWIAFSIARPAPVSAQQGDSVTAAQAPAPKPAPRLTLKVLLHADYVSGDPADVPPVRGFGLRRARLIAQGDLTDRAAVRLMVDPSLLAVGPEGAPPFRGVPLVEAYAEYRARPDVTLRVGQQRLPFGLAASTGAPSLPTPEYPLASRLLVQRVSAFRDIGVAAAGRWGGLELSGGLFNGAGINTRGDSDESRDWIGRISYALVPGRTVGANAWSGHSGALPRIGGVPRRSFFDHADFRRWGIDARWVGQGTTLAAEYLHDRTRHNDAAEHPTPSGEALVRSGWYVLGAHRPVRQWEVVARYDVWDPREPAGAERVVEMTGGVSWYMSEQVLPGLPRLGRPLNAAQRQSRVMAFLEHARPEAGEPTTRLRLRWELLF